MEGTVNVLKVFKSLIDVVEQSKITPMQLKDLIDSGAMLEFLKKAHLTADKVEREEVPPKAH